MTDDTITLTKEQFAALKACANTLGLLLTDPDDAPMRGTAAAIAAKGRAAYRSASGNYSRDPYADMLWAIHHPRDTVLVERFDTGAVAD